MKVKKLKHIQIAQELSSRADSNLNYKNTIPILGIISSKKR